MRIVRIVELSSFPSSTWSASRGEGDGRRKKLSVPTRDQAEEVRLLVPKDMEPGQS
jgi:hypothetical protein